MSELCLELRAAQARVQALEVMFKAANERVQILFKYKNIWADRARAAESRMQQLQSELEALRNAT